MVISPKITWNGYKINRVKSFKYLGIHVDDRLKWLEPINKQGEKANKMQQNLKRIAGGNWGISQIHRWTLYKTVIERMLAHGTSAWCLNPTFKMKRKLSSIQRYPTERSRNEGNRLVHSPSEHLKPNQISFEDGEAYTARKDIINIFTDGSKTEHGVGAAFCVSTNDIRAYQWSAKLNDNNTVFQAELTALHEAVIYASHLPNHNTSKIHVDNRASIIASSKFKEHKRNSKKNFQNPPYKSKNKSLLG
ncbi:hypothetical protein AVEN_112639-1 [Araneus ventricosus]|uniref:Uncharacterized protein n=1 Tax=Araneus ventricosus TaxID=182803 RepID=A0A4Y2SSR9_ARAVE|nr:hypothetical protein AVEN_112639-1 [Araneus ventricosus]